MIYANLTAHGLCYDPNISYIDTPILCLLLKLCEGSLTALVPVAVLVQLDVLQQVELHVGWCGGGSPAVTDSS